uniref:J domain-containing protein n=1 Tax=Opuntia streptacantha TaxID=393608 RepID=A0A7C9CFU7_OPUST
MAQLLKPVCTDPFKLQNPLQGLSRCSRSGRWSVQPTRRQQWTLTAYRGGRQGRNERWRVKAVADDSIRLEAGLADDYYAVLGLTPDATQEQIKKAYYNCMKACHPDLSGDDPESTDFCKFINEVYEVLSDPVQRRVYDEIHGYSLTALNPFLDDSSPKDHVFVDEFSCIGCKNCANVAPDVFKIEEDFGRARVYKQCGKQNSDRVQQAVDSCPVDCIHWTSAAQLSLLEDEMRRVERVNVRKMVVLLSVNL